MLTANTKTNKPFLKDNFLLENEIAEALYHDYAAKMPIIDYHNHLPPDQIASNHNFENISQAWLAGDHYKWRAMRTMGVNEKYITGEGSDFEKFESWAKTVPYTMRNPLYHWTHMELKNYFDVNVLLDDSNAKEIYDHCSQLLQQPNYSTQGLLNRMNVMVVCTTDDPIDDLQHHQKAAQQDMGFKMLPAFRPDKLLNIDKGQTYVKYLETFAEAANINITNLSSFLEALDKRMDFFHANACRLSDHGLEQMYAEDFTDADLDRILQKALDGKAISPDETLVFKSGLLYHFGIRYHARGWVQQFHLGALRNNNKRMERTLGPDTGFDSIGDWEQAKALSRYLDRLDNEDKLSKTILYNLNPRDNEVLASMIGNFNDGSVKGKMQFGSGWWFLDQKDGMTKQLNALSNMSLISCFVGMLTDSRSFLSYPRHEYFRRVLCNIFGTEMQNGELPQDLDLVGKIIQDVCYYNAKNYFDF